MSLPDMRALLISVFLLKGGKQRLESEQKIFTASPGLQFHMLKQTLQNIALQKGLAGWLGGVLVAGLVLNGRITRLIPRLEKEIATILFKTKLKPNQYSLE